MSRPWQFVYWMGVYAVASEFWRRDIEVEVLPLNVLPELRIVGDGDIVYIHVATKEAEVWPNAEGTQRISANDILVLVDYAGKGALDRPDFYILGFQEWKRLFERDVVEENSTSPDVEQPNQQRSTAHRTLRPSDVATFKEQWTPVDRLRHSP